MFTLCSRSRGSARRVEFTAAQTLGVQSDGRGMIECSVSWENGDELPNCFLGRRRLGRPLPCTIRLRTQRSDHMAVGENDFSGHQSVTSKTL
jgi:hypothetical protein